ncbi:MAG: glycosyltransferase involved in cell wall biosynthesis [Planctomycetota bacterium]|jgi:glycosyltransferase involved in cell wall biosynthesis
MLGATAAVASPLRITPVRASRSGEDNQSTAPSNTTPRARTVPANLLIPACLYPHAREGQRFYWSSPRKAWACRGTPRTRARYAVKVNEPKHDAHALSILHVDAERGFSGGEVQVFLLLEGLRSRGHRVSLVCPPGSGAESAARERGLDVLPVPLRNDADLRGVRSIAGILKSGEFDLAHLHTGRATWLGGLAAKLAGIPALTTRRMDRAVKRSLRTRLIYRSLTQRVAAISPSVANCLRAANVPEERIVVIPSSVDPVRVQPPAGADRDGLRRELMGEEAGDSLCILVLAALVPRKGIDVLLSALGALSADERPFLLVAGEGSSRASLEAQTDALGLRGRVRFLGRREDVAELLLAADMMALPSHQEGLGVAALEGMAAGLPILASEVGGLADAVQGERTGLLLPAGNVAAWTAGLRRLCSDADLRERFGVAGRERVTEGFLPDQMTASYVELYREILAENTRG